MRRGTRRRRRRRQQHQRHAQQRHRTAGEGWWRGQPQAQAQAQAQAKRGGGATAQVLKGGDGDVEQRWEEADARYELALVLGNVDELRSCLEAGCDPNCRFDRPYFETPLGLALCARHDGLQLLQFLPPVLPAAYRMQGTANPRQNDPARRDGLLQCMRLLLSRDAHVNKQFTSTHGTVTCLHQAIVHDDAAAAELLLRADASQMLRPYQSALEMAVIRNAYACEKLLFKHLDEHPLLRGSVQQQALVRSLQRVLCKYVVADEHLGAYRLLRANVPVKRQLLSLPHTGPFCRLFACFGYVCRHCDWAEYLTASEGDDPGSFLQQQLRLLAQSPVHRQPAGAEEEGRGAEGRGAEGAAGEQREQKRARRGGGGEGEVVEGGECRRGDDQAESEPRFDWDHRFALAPVARGRHRAASRWGLAQRVQRDGSEDRWRTQLRSVRTQRHPVRRLRAAAGAEAETAEGVAGAEAGIRAQVGARQGSPSLLPLPSSSSSLAPAPQVSSALPSSEAKRTMAGSTPSCASVDKQGAASGGSAKRAKRRGQRAPQRYQTRQQPRAGQGIDGLGSERAPVEASTAGAGVDMADAAASSSARASGAFWLDLPRGVDAFDALRRNPQAVLAAHTGARPVPTLFARTYAAALQYDKLHLLPEDHRASLHAALFQPAFCYLQHFFLHSTQ